MVPTLLDYLFIGINGRHGNLLSLKGAPGKGCAFLDSDEAVRPVVPNTAQRGG